MKHCEEQQCVKLNIEKVKLNPSIGHIATDKGLCVDPQKVQAIIEMPRLTDVARHDTVSGKVPTSFVRHDKTIACMTQKDADFLWDEPQQKAFDVLKAVHQCCGITTWTQSYAVADKREGVTGNDCAYPFGLGE
ncbi:hypothetical protein LSAT2_021793 [Lamellibrachia satsuma]|nr:hypothetical protein LSAT2_021793 [Lamellibrachia satsuma]